MERYGNAACALTEDDLQELVEVPRLETSELFDDPGVPAKPGMRERALQGPWPPRSAPASFTPN
jgi:hypothetical protein